MLPLHVANQDRALLDLVNISFRVVEARVFGDRSHKRRNEKN